jgi:hypothetical protein
VGSGLDHDLFAHEEGPGLAGTVSPHDEVSGLAAMNSHRVQDEVVSVVRGDGRPELDTQRGVLGNDSGFGHAPMLPYLDLSRYPLWPIALHLHKNDLHSSRR